MTVEARPIRNDATISERASEKADRKPKPPSIGPSALDPAPASPPMVKATMKPRASGVIATMKGNGPPTPVTLTRSGPRNCAPV